MATFKISANGAATTLGKKQWHKFEVNRAELQLLEEGRLTRFFRPNLVKPNQIIYTGPRAISLLQYMEKNPSVHKMYSVLAQFVETMKEVGMYSLRLQNLVLDSRYIFVKEATGEVYFVYQPLVGQQVGVNVFSFLRELLSGLKLDGLQIKQECQEIINFLNGAHFDQVAELEQWIWQKYPQIYQQIANSNNGKSGYIGSVRLAYQQEVETSLLVREEVQRIQACIIRRKNPYEEYRSEGMDFTIGKEVTASYQVIGNGAISRMHAQVIYHDSNYYIQDLKSTNYSYYNDEMMVPEASYLLKTGDRIRLADEEFEIEIK